MMPDGAIPTIVVGLQGRAVADRAPQSGEVLTWNAQARHWEPGTGGAGIWVGPTPPTDPSAYPLWFNPTGGHGGVTLRWDTPGLRWDTAGNQWDSGATGVLSVWYDGMWVPVGGAAGPAGPPGPAGGLTLEEAMQVFLPLSGGTMLGNLILDGPPGPGSSINQAVTMGYVGNLITGALHFIGTYNAATNQAQYTVSSGLTGTAIVPASQALDAYLIVSVAGTPPSSAPPGIAGIPLVSTEWLISDGQQWYPIQHDELDMLASEIAVTPPVLGQTDVQGALTALAAGGGGGGGGNFLPLTGGIMAGPINMSGLAITNLPASPPPTSNNAAPANWVMEEIAAQTLYQGIWHPDTNTPNLSLPAARQNGFSWIAVTPNPNAPFTVPNTPSMPGLNGQRIYNFDHVVWSSVQNTFGIVHAGNLSVTEAETLFLLKAGDTMAGRLYLQEAVPTVNPPPTMAARVDWVLARIAESGGGGGPGGGISSITVSPPLASTQNPITSGATLSLGIVPLNLGGTGINAASNSALLTALGGVGEAPANNQHHLRTVTTLGAASWTQGLALTGGTLAGNVNFQPGYMLTLSGAPTQPNHAATQAWVNSQIAAAAIDPGQFAFPEPDPTGLGYLRASGSWEPGLKLAGGTMGGAINMGNLPITNLLSPPAGNNDAASRYWVLQETAATILYQGTWQADLNHPDLRLVETHQNGFGWIAIFAQANPNQPYVMPATPVIPGIPQGTEIWYGDHIVWDGHNNRFDVIHSSNLSVTEAEELFVQKTGDIMVGNLYLSGGVTPVTETMRAATQGWVQQLVSGLPSGNYLPLSGGTLTPSTAGAIVLTLANGGGLSVGTTAYFGVGAVGQEFYAAASSGGNDRVLNFRLNPYRSLAYDRANDRFHFPWGPAGTSDALLISGADGSVNIPVSLTVNNLTVTGTATGNFPGGGGGDGLITALPVTVAQGGTGVSTFAVNNPVINYTGHSPLIAGDGTNPLWAVSGPNGYCGTYGATMAITRFGTGNFDPYLEFIRGRGSLAAPTAPGVGDSLGGLKFGSWIGGTQAYRYGAQIFAYPTQDHSTSQLGTGLTLQVTAPGGFTEVRAVNVEVPTTTLANSVAGFFNPILNLRGGDGSTIRFQPLSNTPVNPSRDTPYWDVVSNRDWWGAQTPGSQVPPVGTGDGHGAWFGMTSASATDRMWAGIGGGPGVWDFGGGNIYRGYSLQFNLRGCLEIAQAPGSVDFGHVLDLYTPGDRECNIRMNREGNAYWDVKVWNQGMEFTPWDWSRGRWGAPSLVLSVQENRNYSFYPFLVDPLQDPGWWQNPQTGEWQPNTSFRAVNNFGAEVATFESQWDNQCNIRITSPNHRSYWLVSQAGSNSGQFWIWTPGPGVATNLPFQIYADGRVGVTGGQVTGTSDPRTKEILGSYEDGLAEIMQLDPIRFRHNGKAYTPKDDESVIRIGIDGAAIDKIIPESTTVVERKLDEDDAKPTNVLQVDTGPVIWALVNAVKELKAELDELKATRH